LYVFKRFMRNHIFDFKTKIQKIRKM